MTDYFWGFGFISFDIDLLHSDCLQTVSYIFADACLYCCNWRKIVAWSEQRVNFEERSSALHWISYKLWKELYSVILFQFYKAISNCSLETYIVFYLKFIICLKRFHASSKFSIKLIIFFFMCFWNPLNKVFDATLLLYSQMIF